MPQPLQMANNRERGMLVTKRDTNLVFSVMPTVELECTTRHIVMPRESTNNYLCHKQGRILSKIVIAYGTLTTVRR